MREVTKLVRKVVKLIREVIKRKREVIKWITIIYKKKRKLLNWYIKLIVISSWIKLEKKSCVHQREKISLYIIINK